MKLFTKKWVLSYELHLRLRNIVPVIEILFSHEDLIKTNASFIWYSYDQESEQPEHHLWKHKYT